MTELLLDELAQGSEDAFVNWNLLPLIMGNGLSATQGSGLEQNKYTLAVRDAYVNNLIATYGQPFTSALLAKLNALDIRSMGQPTITGRVITFPYVTGNGTASTYTLTIPQSNNDQLAPRTALSSAATTADGTVESQGGRVWINAPSARAHVVDMIAEVDPNDATSFGFNDFDANSADDFGSLIGTDIAVGPRFQTKTSGTYAGGSDVAQCWIPQSVMATARPDAGAGQPAFVVHWHDKKSGEYALFELFRRVNLDITSGVEYWGYGNTDVRVDQITDESEVTLDFETVAGAGAVGVSVRNADNWEQVDAPIRFNSTMAGAGTTADPKRVANPITVLANAAAYTAIVAANTDGSRDGIYLYPEN